MCVCVCVCVVHISTIAWLHHLNSNETFRDSEIGTTQ